MSVNKPYMSGIYRKRHRTPPPQQLELEAKFNQQIIDMKKAGKTVSEIVHELRVTPTLIARVLQAEKDNIS